MTFREKLAYAAGIVEGEGSIFIKRSQDWQRFHVRMQVAMIDQEAVEFLFELFGGTYYTYKHNGKPYFLWQVNGKRAASSLTKLLPFFRLKRRIRRAKLCIQLDARIVPNNSKPLSIKERAIRLRLFKEAQCQ